MTRRILFAALLSLCFGPLAIVFAQTPVQKQFLSFDQAEPVLKAMPSALPAALQSAPGRNATAWSQWVQSEDREVRERLNRGEEDTLTNFLRLSDAFTPAPRIDIRSLLSYGNNSAVTSLAERRAGDLTRAMASDAASERVAHLRSFLEKEGYSFKTSVDQAKVNTYLLANLARMRDEFLSYLKRPRGENPFDLFKDRGISLDTNLWPDFLIDRHLQHMVQAGLLKPRSIHRVAIVGPGLDFANKENGTDFYPPQTIQPFAVLDSLIRLGLADPATVELSTLDISSDVNFHIARARERAGAGIPYILQLPWDSAAPLAPEYRRNFSEYWQQLGSRIGQPDTPIAVPAAQAGAVQTRAVKVRPEIVQRITPVDMNVVCQHQRLSPDKGYDLVIGTNIFIYYNEFEQSLARANIALMLKPGGFLLSNDKLPEDSADDLEDSLLTSQIVAKDPEYMFSYERR